jgi:hypothetical protein
METRYGNEGYSSTDFTKIFTWHLAALPGWTGYKSRTTYHSEWQISYNIRRLSRSGWLKEIDAEIYPEDNDTSTISSLSATIHFG